MKKIKWKEKLQAFKRLLPMCACFSLLYFLQYPTSLFTTETRCETFSHEIETAVAQSGDEKIVNVNYTHSGKAGHVDIGDTITYAKYNNTMSMAKSGYGSRVIWGQDEFSSATFSFSGYSFKPSVLLSNAFSIHMNNDNEPVMDFFDVKLMFSKRIEDLSRYQNFTFITLAQADAILDASGQEKTSENYQSLIGQTLQLNLEFLQENKPSATADWQIVNIIVECEVDKLFTSLFEDYMIAYYFVPSDTSYSFNFDFAASSFSNVSYVKQFKEHFPEGEWHFSVNKTELDASKREAIEKAYSSIQSTTFSATVSLVLFPFLSIGFGVLLDRKQKNTKLSSIMLCSAGSFAFVYLILLIVNSIIGFAPIFSNYGIVSSLLSFLAVSVCILILQDFHIKKALGMEEEK